MCFFLNFCSSKPWIRIRIWIWNWICIRIRITYNIMLDPDPYPDPDSMNQYPQQWCISLYQPRYLKQTESLVISLSFQGT
jgi:hypothetical protein